MGLKNEQVEEIDAIFSSKEIDDIEREKTLCFHFSS